MSNVPCKRLTLTLTASEGAVFEWAMDAVCNFLSPDNPDSPAPMEAQDIWDNYKAGERWISSHPEVIEDTLYRLETQLEDMARQCDPADRKKAIAGLKHTTSLANKIRKAV